MVCFLVIKLLPKKITYSSKFFFKKGKQKIVKDHLCNNDAWRGKNLDKFKYIFFFSNNKEKTLIECISHL